LSHISIARSYAVLLGLEEYAKVKKSVKKGAKHVKHVEQKVVHPQRPKPDTRPELERSESIGKEKKIIAPDERKAMEASKHKHLGSRILARLGSLRAKRSK
jgi:hypothetical protein